MIPLYKPHIPEGAVDAIERVLGSGQLAGDGNLPEFERRFGEFVGSPSVVATAEFSRSIEMALRMAGIGHGDAVLVSPLACLATTTPLLQVGARPVWCDVDPDTGTISADDIRRRHHPGVKGVLLYHWVGVPGDVHGILAAAADCGLAVIEDAGEALGAEYAGARIGSHGCDATVFSFSPARHITTGEGAAIAFRDPHTCERARSWRRYGIPPSGFRDQMGEIRTECDVALPGTHNFMNRIAGALGALQMDCLPQLVQACRANGEFFERALSDLPGIQPLKPKGNAVPSYWVYCFRCQQRDALLRKLRAAGVYASLVHARNDSYSCFGGSARDLPAVARFMQEQLCIPCGWWVSSEDRAFIAETIRSGW